MPTTTPALKLLTAGSIAVLALTSCNGDNGNGEAGADTTTLRLSHFMEPSHPHEACGVKAIQDHLEGSSIQVDSYPSAQLGGETQSLEQVYTGNLDMSINGPSFLGVYHDNFNVLDAGYLFSDSEALLDFQDSDEMEELMDDFQEESEMKVFPGWYYGVRHVTADRPVEGPADLAGLNLRTPDAPLYRNTLGAMGASPTPMALNELYMALQQGTVDGQENPAAIIDTMNLYEVQDHLILTGHMVQAMHVSVAQNVWESFSDDDQQLLEEAIRAGGDAATQCVLEQEEELIQGYVDGDDMEVHDIDTTEFAERVQEEMSEGYEFSDLYVQILENQD